MATAQERVVIQETDSASANERLYHHRLNICKGDVLRDIMVCHNHQCNLVETALVGCTYEKLISSFFSFTHFAQASSHFTKLKQAVQEHVRENTSVIVTAGPAVSEKDAEFLEELCSMMVGVKAHAFANRQESDENTRGIQQYIQKISAFKSMWNGDLSERSSVYYHRCVRCGPQSSWCCKNNEESHSKMASTLISLMSTPETPAPGKWTKLWNSLMFVVSWLIKSQNFAHRDLSTLNVSILDNIETTIPDTDTKEGNSNIL